MSRRHVEQLIQSSYDGELTAEQETELAELLRSSAEARDAWCDHAFLIGDLRRHATQAASRPGSIPASASYAAARQRRRQGFGSLAAAAAVLALGAWILTTVFVRPGKPSVEFSSSGGTLLHSEGGTPFEGDQLEHGRRLEIRQGVVRLDFPEGVVGILEGPGSLLVESKSRLRFEGGRGHFHVPAAAKGFTVAGTAMEVRDLGTEFGVDFRDAARSSASVFRGRVELRAAGQTLELTAGQSARLRDGSLEPQSEPGAYLTALPDKLPEARIDFDRIESGSIPIHGSLTGTGEWSARIVADDPDAVALVEGPVGSALEFRGDAELVSNWPGIHGSAPRTVSLWFRIDPDGDYRSAPPLAFWGLPLANVNRKFKVSVVTEHDGRHYPRVSLGRWYANGSTRIRDDAWHHLAVVWDGGADDSQPRVRLYLDGRAEAFSYVNATSRTEFGTETLDTGAQPLSIGRYEAPPTAGRPYFRGAIDELRVIAGALSSEEIIRLKEGAF